MGEYGKVTNCHVYCIHIKVQNVKKHADEIIKSISDTSWISSLNAIDQISYESRSTKTISRLVNSILKKVEDVVTEEFGEYLVSHTAQNLLVTTFNHGKVPLAELFKEKIIGNMGFDFHTESVNKIILFGEAKYSGSINPYTKAIEQIVEFINERKDIGELADVQKFVSVDASTNAITNKKGYVAAFSINAQKPETILKNAIESIADTLLEFPELYLIGVEIDAQVTV